jgi:hypothetical protein
VLRGLRALRWLRRATWFCLAFPVVLTGLIVLANWLTGGVLRFFVSGAPWTHRFWSGLLYTLVLGVFLVMLTLARRCPRSRGPFHHRGERRRAAQQTSGAYFQTNVFTPRCLSCGLRIDGANRSPSPPH